MKNNSLYLVLIYLLISSCAEKSNLSCSIGKEKIQKANVISKKELIITKVHCPSIGKLFSTQNITSDIEPQFNEIKGKPFFCYFTKNLDLTCKNILDTADSFIIQTSSFLKKRERVIFLFQKDTLHFIDMSALKYYQFKVEKDSLKQTATYNFSTNFKKNNFMLTKT